MGRWMPTDRPLVVTFGHVSVPVLYLTGTAVSPLRFTSDATRALIASPMLPAMHIVAAGGLFLALAWFREPWHRALAATFSVLIWAFTTVLLTEATFAHSPRGTLWSADLSLIITLAAILMAVRWGVPGTDGQ